MKNKQISFLTISIIVLLLISQSCKTPRTSVSLSAKPSQIYHGDSVRLSWKIKNSENVTKIRINQSIDILSMAGDTCIKFDSTTQIVLDVFTTDRKKPITRRKKVWVQKPVIHAFTAYRDRFVPKKIIFNWKVSGAEKVDIEGEKTKLKLSGQDSIVDYNKTTFNLIVSTPFETIIKSCYVGSIIPGRPLINNDTSIEYLPNNHKIMMEISETDISEYPDEIKLKVIVYDSTGNFITHLAPPYGTNELAEKYFKRITDKAKNTVLDIDFEVREVHKSPEKYDIAMVLDYSGSMEPSIEKMEDAAINFIQQKYPDDHYSIVKFDHRFENTAELSNNIDTLINKAQFTGENNLAGGTALYAAINKGLQTLKNSSNKKRIVVLTDGIENASLLYLFQYSATINQLIDSVRMNNAQLIILGMGGVNALLLRELAFYTNGSFYFFNNSDDLNNVYMDVNHSLSTYYEIIIKPLKMNIEHILQLEYFNNIKTTNVQRPYYIGNAADFLKFEMDESAYWFNEELKKENYHLAAAPQALVNFTLNGDTISSEYRTALNNIAKFVNTKPDIKVEIFGHTDSHGSLEYNQELSDRRAKAVFADLLKLGVPSNNLKWKGYGETIPIWKDDKKEWAAQENRRVEIVIWIK